ncbi:hypothetical protein D3C86_2095210 [compost metagenome]
MFIAGNGSTRGDYHEWEARLTRNVVGLDWGVAYIDTDLSQNQCMSYYGYTDVCTATVVVSASKTF